MSVDVSTCLDSKSALSQILCGNIPNSYNHWLNTDPPHSITSQHEFKRKRYLSFKGQGGPNNTDTNLKVCRNPKNKCTYQSSTSDLHRKRMKCEYYVDEGCEFRRNYIRNSGISFDCIGHDGFKNNYDKNCNISNYSKQSCNRSCLDAVCTQDEDTQNVPQIRRINENESKTDIVVTSANELQTEPIDLSRKMYNKVNLIDTPPLVTICGSARIQRQSHANNSSRDKMSKSIRLLGNINRSYLSQNISIESIKYLKNDFKTSCSSHSDDNCVILKASEVDDYETSPREVSVTEYDTSIKSNQLSLSSPQHPQESLLRHLLTNRNDNLYYSKSNKHLAKPCACTINLKHSYVKLSTDTAQSSCSQVYDWLVAAIKFAVSTPKFSALPSEDKRILLLDSWSKIILLFMAEEIFSFSLSLVQEAECERHSDYNESEDLTSGINKLASKDCTDDVTLFIHKCNKLGLDPKLYSLLRMSVLFNPDVRGVTAKATINEISRNVQRCTWQHSNHSTEGMLQYGRLLLMLPLLYSIESHVIERLFCLRVDHSDVEHILNTMNRADL